MAMMIAGTTITSFAGESEITAIVPTSFEPITIETDLNDIDLTKPFSETYHTTDSNGEEITVELSFVPAPAQTKGSSTTTASAGTWTSSFTGGIFNQSYKFDLAKSGSQWTMSNARSHLYSDVSVCDNQWIALYNATAF